MIERGLIAEPNLLIRRLSAVSYYRLSGYFYPFRRVDEDGKLMDDFKDGTTLDVVWSRYCFDRRLRMLTLDAIERIEVAIRTQLVYHFSHKYGAFGYCDEKNLPNLKIERYLDWRSDLAIEVSRSKAVFKQHFFAKYTAHENLPVWMLSELMSMGSLLTFYKGVDNEVQTQVASHFGMADQLFITRLTSLNAARNLCAHHARFWNQKLGYAAGLPQRNKHPLWHEQDKDGERILKNDRVGTLLFICRVMLSQITPTSQWYKRIEELFCEYPEIPLKSMGLPENWQEHSLWSAPQNDFSS